MVPETEKPREDDFEEASNRLNDGLRNCRAVVSGYRTLLGADQPNGPAKPEGSDGEEPPAATENDTPA